MTYSSDRISQYKSKALQVFFQQDIIRIAKTFVSCERFLKVISGRLNFKYFGVDIIYLYMYLDGSKMYLIIGSINVNKIYLNIYMSRKSYGALCNCSRAAFN